MANGRYFIQPGGDISRGLQGLGQAFLAGQQYKQQRALQQAKMQEMQRLKQQKMVNDKIFNAVAMPEEIPGIAREMGYTKLADQYEQGTDEQKNAIEMQINRLAAVRDPERFNAYQKGFQSLTGDLDAGIKVGAQQILPDSGLTIQSTNKGLRVLDPERGQLFGKEAKAAIEDARNLKIDTQRRIAGQKREAKLKVDKELLPQIEQGKISVKQAADFSKKAVDQMESTYKSIDTLNQAIDAIDRGAKTGIIYSMLPSIRSASIDLDNIQKGMALDIVSTGKFGPLSEGEMKFAFDKALPKTKNPEDLKKWLIRKRNAMDKTAEYLMDTITFLAQTNPKTGRRNTMDDWVLKLKADKEAQKAETDDLFNEFENM